MYYFNYLQNYAQHYHIEYYIEFISTKKTAKSVKCKIKTVQYKT